MNTKNYDYIIKDCENKKYLAGLGIGSCLPVTGTLQWTTNPKRAMRCTLKQANQVIGFITGGLEYEFDLTIIAYT